MRTVLRGTLPAALLALAGCSLSIDPESVKPPGPRTPAMALAPATGSFPLAFTTVANTSAPAARVVNLTNSGGGTLAAPVVTLSAGMNTWLQAPVSVSGPAGGPFAITVQPLLVATGTYSGTVTVTCAGASNSPLTFNVTYDVASAAPALDVNPLSLTFSATAGGANPAAKQLTITNTGGGTLAIPSVNVTSGGSWLSTGSPVASGGGYTVAVNATVGVLAAGTYNGQISIASSGATGSPKTVNVQFTVGSASQPTLSLSPGSMTFNATTGDVSPPAAQPLTVSNAGAGTLASPTASAITYSANGSGWLTVDPATGSAGGPYTLLVHASVGALAADTYTATFNVLSAGASNTPQQYTVTFNVAAKPFIALDKTTLTFTRIGNGAPVAQTVLVTNTGGGVLADPITQVNYVSGANWLTVGSTGGTGGPFTITVQPNDTLAAGTYTANVQIACAGASNTPRTVTVTYQVPGISLSPGSLSFSATQGGANPTPQNLAVSNSGGGALQAPTATVTSGGTWLAVGTITGGAGGPYTVPVQATTGALAAGTYTGTIEVAATGAKNSPQTYGVTFTVAPLAAPVMTVTPASLAFNALQGGASPAAQNLAATNTGTGTLAAPTAAVQSAGTPWLSVGAVTGAAGGPYQIPVQVATGTLTPNTYSGTIRVTAPGGATPAFVDVPITFNVSAPAVGGCIASSGRKVCASAGGVVGTGGLTAGGASQVSTASRVAKKSTVTAGASPRAQSTNRTIRASVLVPGNATP